MDPLITVFSIIYTLVLGAFALGSFAYWYQNRIELRHYKSIGFLMGFILIILEFITLILLAINDVTPSIIQIILIDFIAFFRLAAFTIIGIESCNILGLFSFPWIFEAFGEPQSQLADSGADNREPDSLMQMEAVEILLEEEQSATLAEAYETVSITEDFNQIVELEPEMVETEIVEQKVFNLNEMLWVTTLVTLGIVLFSVILFLLTKPEMSSLIREQLGGADVEITPLSFIVVITFAFVEELTFRLGLQNFLARYFDWQNENYWIAIFLTSLLWTIGHVGALDPNWVKMVQIFPAGLALGWLFKRYGAESTILAHVAFNVILVFPAPYLIS